VPIDAPGVKLNPILIGTWQEKTDSSTLYQVSSQDIYTCKIIESHHGNTDTKQYLAYASVVNGSTFLNLWEDQPDESNHTYMLYRLDVKNENSVTLVEVTENIDEQFTSSEQLKKFISGNMKNSYFFGKEETELIRVGK